MLAKYVSDALESYKSETSGFKSYFCFDAKLLKYLSSNVRPLFEYMEHVTTDNIQFEGGSLTTISLKITHVESITKIPILDVDGREKKNMDEEKKNAEATSTPVPEKEGAATMKIETRSIDSQFCKAKSKKMVSHEDLIDNCVTPIIIQHEVRTTDDAKTFRFRETSDYLHQRK